MLCPHGVIVALEVFMEIVLEIMLGIALAAACGFRVFVPMLVISIAALSGHLQLSGGFEWLGTWPALVVFAVATVLEIAAYYIPWLDHLFDSVAGPAAVVAGIVAASSVMHGMEPWLKWTLAVIAGGGAAGIVQGLTTVTRLASTATTGGLGNPVVATGEAAGAVGLSVLAVALPVAAFCAVMIVLFLTVRWGVRRLRREKAASP
jgi:hypothetical protein